MSLGFKELNEYLLRNASGLLSDWLPGGRIEGREYKCGSIQGGSGGSFSVNTSTGVWCEFDGGQGGGDLIALYAAIKNVSMGEAFKMLGGEKVVPGQVYNNGLTKSMAATDEVDIVIPPEDVEAPRFAGQHWAYRDFDGRLMFYIERVDQADGGKHFLPLTWSKSKANWDKKGWPGKRPIYGLDLLAKRLKAPVLVVEGEKTCDAARSILKDYVVVTWPNGAGAVMRVNWAPLFDRDKVLLWPDADADNKGQAAMAKLAQHLSGKIKEIKVLDVSGMPDKWDAADALAEGWDSKAWVSWAKPRAKVFEVKAPEVSIPMPSVGDEPHSPEDYNGFDKAVEKASAWPGEFGFYDMVPVPTKNDPDKVKFVPMYNELAKWCFKKKNICFTDKEQLKFDGKKWNWLQKTGLSNLLIKWNKDYLQPAHHDNFIKQLRATCYSEALGINPELASGHLNVDNGVVNIASGELLPHDFRYRFRYVAPIKYDPVAECPRWGKFLCDTFENNVELIDLAQRLFGYVLIGGRPFLHKAFVLYGSGRNGKSTFLDVLRAVIGRDAYSVVSMAKLDKEFSLVSLEGKLANIVEETPNEAINAEVFKTLVGGGEVTVAHKGFDEYQMRCDAKFVFACNDMPIFKDKSVGLEDRLIFMPFNRYIAEEDRDTLILDKLYAELPGILNWAIEGAKMMANERMIPKYAVLNESKEAYKMDTNVIYAWYKDELEIVPAASSKIHTAEIYRRYVADMRDRGNNPYSRERFIKQLKKHVAEDCNKKGIFFAKNLRDGSGGPPCLDVVRFIHGVTVSITDGVQQKLYYNRD